MLKILRAVLRPMDRADRTFSAAGTFDLGRPYVCTYSGSTINQSGGLAPSSLARLRRENELLRAERDLLKKATAFFAKETNR